jgi:hypothetical protein
MSYLCRLDHAIRSFYETRNNKFNDFVLIQASSKRNKISHHDINEKLLKAALNTKTNSRCSNIQQYVAIKGHYMNESKLICLFR